MLAPHTLEQFRQQLKAAAARLTAGVAALQSEALRPTGSGTGGSADAAADPGEQTAESGVAGALFEAEGQTLAEVNAALERLDRGTFGKCERCGHAVGRDRLDALPHARLCVRCAAG